MKYLFAVALALGLAFAAYGAAASLDVNGGTIQAGEDNQLTCTAGAEVAGWGYETSDDLVHFVRIIVNDDCLGNSMFVNITGNPGGVVLFSAAQAIITDECNDVLEAADEACISLGAADGFVATDPADITDIHITIEGAGGDPNN